MLWGDRVVEEEEQEKSSAKDVPVMQEESPKDDLEISDEELAMRYRRNVQRASEQKQKPRLPDSRRQNHKGWERGYSNIPSRDNRIQKPATACFKCSSEDANMYRESSYSTFQLLCENCAERSQVTGWVFAVN